MRFFFLFFNRYATGRHSPPHRLYTRHGQRQKQRWQAAVCRRPESKSREASHGKRHVRPTGRQQKQHGHRKTGTWPEMQRSRQCSNRQRSSHHVWCCSKRMATDPQTNIARMDSKTQTFQSLLSKTSCKTILQTSSELLFARSQPKSQRKVVAIHTRPIVQYCASS